jgi:3-dehydro-L-gulonate 2-dehydrogenase
MRISFKEIQRTLNHILLKHGFAPEKAGILSKVFTESSLDGVYSHGLNRFPRFIHNVKEGIVKVDAEPEKINTYGNIEQWNGNLGPGILNALSCMSSALKIAGSAGIGCVAISNTNHWMRGGTYGWQAADNGCIGICWTNTEPNMVAWGGKDPVLGNNPLIIAIPRKEGNIVLDMAMSQYSYGKMEAYTHEGKDLEFIGGLDGNGLLTKDPQEIISNESALPIGFWKGSGLSFVLDILAAVLAKGDPTVRIGSRSEEYGLSQVFIAISIKLLDNKYSSSVIHEVLQNLHKAEPKDEGGKTYYPGEKTLLTRIENQKLGIPVNTEIWDVIKNL